MIFFKTPIYTNSQPTLQFTLRNYPIPCSTQNSCKLVHDGNAPTLKIDINQSDPLQTHQIDLSRLVDN